MTHSRRENLIGYIFAIPSIIGFLLFFGIPFLISIFYCFTRGSKKIEYVGFENFINLFNCDSFKLAMKNTIIFNLVSVPLIIAISLFISVILNSKLRGGSFFRTTLTLPLVIPVASVALLWENVFLQSGFLNQVLSKFGIVGPDYINSKWAFIVLVMLYIWKNCGYNMIIFIAGLNNIPKEYYEAAQIDGCGKVRFFFKVTLPLLVPTIFFVFIISIINSLRIYRDAYMLFGTYPNSSIYMLQHFMNNNFVNLNYQKLCTASVIVFVFIALGLGAIFKLQRKYEV